MSSWIRIKFIKANVKKKIVFRYFFFPRSGSRGLSSLRPVGLIISTLLFETFFFRHDKIINVLVDFEKERSAIRIIFDIFYIWKRKKKKKNRESSAKIKNTTRQMSFKKRALMRGSFFHMDNAKKETTFSNDIIRTVN